MSIRAAAFLLLAAGLSPPIGGARAQGSFTLIGQGPATDMSADGSVVVGYDDDTGEAWRWSADTGAVPLGNTFTLGGRSDPGSPDVSGDGTRISGTFHDWEKDVSLPGRWSAEDGWVLFDDVRGAARGLSEDGSTLVGLLWDIDGSVGVGLAAAWNRRDGLVILGDPGRNSCANEANSDGSVIVGWIENPGSGTWHPTAWVDGRATILATTPAFCEAKSVSPDGRIIVGQAFDDTYNRRVAAVWLRGDYGWVREDLGALPGTLAGYGHAAALDLSADGEVIVGVNRFDWNTSTGFVWTPVAGLQDIADFLVRAGIAVPEDFDIEAVTGVSDDGKVFAGYGRSRDDWPSTLRSFLFKVSADAGRIAGRTVENPVAKAGLESDTGTLPELDLRKYDQPR